MGPATDAEADIQGEALSRGTLEGFWAGGLVPDLKSFECRAGGETGGGTVGVGLWGGGEQNGGGGGIYMGVVDRMVRGGGERGLAGARSDGEERRARGLGSSYLSEELEVRCASAVIAFRLSVWYVLKCISEWVLTRSPRCRATTHSSETVKNVQGCC